MYMSIERENVPGQAIQNRQENRKAFAWAMGSQVFMFLGVAVLIAGLGGWEKYQTSITQESSVVAPEDYEVPVHPTLLSVVDPKTGAFVHVSEHALYDRLKEHLLTLRLGMINDDDIPVLLDLDKDNILFGEALTVSLPASLEGASSEIPKAKQDVRTLMQEIQVKEEDVMALYCPAHEADHTQFRDALTIHQARFMGKQTNSFQIASFPLVREETCEFRLFASSQDGSYELLAKSPTLHLQNALETPMGIHLALTGNPSEMSVQFNTGVLHGTPVVAYGKAPSGDDDSEQPDLSLKVEGDSHTYGAQDMCNEPANVTDVSAFIDPGLFHKVVLTDLEPDTAYMYKVGVTGGQGIVWSDVYTFQSAPSGDDPDYSFSFLVYADQGVPNATDFYGASETARLATREVQENNARMVHHFGDLSYARGVGHIWDQWMDIIQPYASQIPYMVGIGNHEYDYIDGEDHDPSGAGMYQPRWGNYGNDSGGECGVPTAARFAMPANGNGVFWYSYDYANVHTIMLSAEHDLSSHSDQYQWLEQDLQSVDRTKTPWVLVETHRPLYESEFFPDNAKVALFLRRELEELLYKHKVDMVLSGHYHTYQRTCTGLYKSKCDAGGPVHLTVGTAGARHYAAVLYPQRWTEVTLTNFGYGRITVHNSSALQFEFIANEYDGRPLDQVWLTK